MHMEERASAAGEPSSSHPTKKRRKSGASQRTSTGSAGTSAATTSSLDGRTRKLTAAQRALQEAAEAEEQPATPPATDGPSATLIVRNLQKIFNHSSAIMRTRCRCEQHARDVFAITVVSLRCLCEHCCQMPRHLSASPRLCVSD